MNNESVVALWLVFLGFWILSGILFKAPSKNSSDTIYWLQLLSWLAMISLVFRSIWEQFLAPSPSRVLELTAVAATVTGLAFAIWARARLGVYWSTLPKVTEHHCLITAGPYHYIRHPIYAGTLLGLLGTAVVGGKLWWSLFVAAAVVFAYRIRAEERILTGNFANEYAEYKKRSWALIPPFW